MSGKQDKGSEMAVRVDDVYKDFYLPHEKSNSLKSQIINIFKKKDKGADIQHALRGVSFEVKKGDFFGIVGRNGCGKSTLLKIISEIYQPTKGSVSVSGKLVPFIELGVGFNPELTGRENVYLNGALLGFSQKEMEAKYNDIVKFAELEEFMDQKLKNYSSGMQVRLAFSVAIQAQGDIMLFDEVLAVGDEAFQRKCDDFFDKVRKDKTKTVILVTHSMSSVKKYCNKAVLIQDGGIKILGDPNDVANEYTNENIGLDSANGESGTKDEFALGLNQDIPEYIIKLQTKKILSSSDDLVFYLEYKVASNKIVDTAVVEINDISRSNTPVILDRIKDLQQRDGTYIIKYKYPLKNINDGEYKIISTLRNREGDVLAFTSSERSAEFAVRNNDKSSKYPLLREHGKVVSVEKK